MGTLKAMRVYAALSVVGIVGGAFGLCNPAVVAAPLPSQQLEASKESDPANAPAIPDVDVFENGDIYFLMGWQDKDWGKDFWNELFKTTKWLNRNHFRVIINPATTAAYLRAAVQSPSTSVIVWMAHSDGDNFVLRDVYENTLPKDIFKNGAGPRLKQIVLGSCSDEVVKPKYEFAPSAYVRTFKGVLDYDREFFPYIKGQSWKHWLSEDLGIKLKK